MTWVIVCRIDKMSSDFLFKLTSLMVNNQYEKTHAISNSFHSSSDRLKKLLDVISEVINKIITFWLTLCIWTRFLWNERLKRTEFYILFAVIIHSSISWIVSFMKACKSIKIKSSAKKYIGVAIIYFAKFLKNILT